LSSLGQTLDAYMATLYWLRNHLLNLIGRLYNRPACVSSLPTSSKNFQYWIELPVATSKRNL